VKLPELIATLGGLGRMRPAPGTIASLAALVTAWLLASLAGRGALLIAAIFATALGGWASELYARNKGEHDPSECVIDELAGQWIACAFAPLNPIAYAVAFVLFRLLDIFKPWPISALERLPGGLGIMADDCAAALVTALAIAVLAHASLV
jgi:phosphatidylglycerophosphatase A